MRSLLACVPVAVLFAACSHFEPSDDTVTAADSGPTAPETGSPDAPADGSADADADANSDADVGADASTCRCPAGSLCQGGVCTVESDPSCGTPIVVASKGTIFEGSICAAPAINVCDVFEEPAHVFRNDTLSAASVKVESMSTMKLSVGQSTADCPKSTGDSCRPSVPTTSVVLFPGDTLVVGRIDTTAGLCAPYRVTFAAP